MVRECSYRRELKRFVMASAALVALVYPQLSLSDSPASSPAAAIRAEYTRLRNVDPESDDPVHRDEWEALARTTGEYISRASTLHETTRIRLDGADISLRLWRAGRNERSLQEAKTLIQPILSGSSESPAYFEAALLQGDIEVCSARSLQEAARWYQEALGGEAATARRAAQRLQGIRLETFDHFVPAPEIEQPRPIRQVAERRFSPRRTVVIDPGHGGDDSGAVGAHNLIEKEVTLDLALRVREILEREYATRVILTRTDDVFVPLARRTAIANNSGAKVFLSLHTNASPLHQLNGLETYYLDNTDDQASRRLAERENSVPSGGDLDDLSFIVSDLIQSGKIEDSIRLSRVVDSALRRGVLPVYSDGRSRGIKKAPFFVLVGAHMPCSLLELFFIDNQQDAQYLAKQGFRDIVARAIADGIALFLDQAGSGGVTTTSPGAATDKASRQSPRASRKS